MIIGVSILSVMTMVPNVMNSVMMIGVPQIRMTLAFLCRANIIIPTKSRLNGSMTSINSS